MDKIREAQKTDKEIAEIKERMSKGKAKGFREDEHDTLWFEDRVYVPNDPEIRKLILQEAMIHRIRFTQEIPRCIWI